MKKTFKLPLLALVVSISFAACKGHRSGNAADSVKKDSSVSVKNSTATTAKVDTTKPSADTGKMKKDTISKTTTKTTVHKKTEVRKSN